jgi:hypothetical protein
VGGLYGGLSGSALDIELDYYEHSMQKPSMLPVEQTELDLPDLTEDVFEIHSFAGSKATLLAPKNSNESCAFNRQQIYTNSNAWYRKCLMLQRMARGLPAVYPTAFAASQAVPEKERIHSIKDYRRGMIGFSYDPRIPNTAGHVFEIAGRNEAGTILTFTNDAKNPGEVDVVPLSFYTDNWGQQLQFAATWLNGYDFSDFNKKPEPVFEGSLGERYERSLEHLKKIRHDKKKAGFDKLANELTSPIKEMEKLLKKWKNK